MNEIIKQLHLTQVDILKEIDKFCRNNDLKYSLYAGTLLGSIRHRGFIPWDDDLDICMTRNDYNEFLRLWDDRDHPGLLIQNKDINNSFNQTFTKIRKDHTVFWQDGEPNDQYHIGIFVDIFPIDRIPSGLINRLLFKFLCVLYLILSRELTPVNGKMIEKAITWLVLLIIRPAKRRRIREMIVHVLEKWDRCEDFSMVATERIETLGIPLPSCMMDELVELEFEDDLFLCTSHWDEYLTLTYKNYMQLPPIEDRVWKHKPKLIDFYHNFNELT